MNAVTDAIDTSLVLRLARAVARPGGNALLIDPENHAAGWVTIESAVTSGQAFAVEVADDVLALDSDEPELASVVDRIRQELIAIGAYPVLLNSGRPGHLHLFCRLKPLQLDHYKQRAKAAGLDIRRTIRPPLSPHRCGLSIELLYPADPAEVVASLAPPIRRRSKALSARMARLLQTGAAKSEGYDSRSSMIQALALAFVNTGATQSDLLAALLDPGNGAGEKMRQRSAESARQYVDACWTKALQHSKRRPAIRDGRAALEAIRAIRTRTVALPWNSRGGPSDFAVLEAHLGLASELGRVVYHADVRTIAERSGLAVSTIVKAHRRLRDAGWLRLQRRGYGTEATIWTLKLPGRCGTSVNTHISPETNSPGTSVNTLISLGGDVESVHVRSDVWRRSGLGKATMNVWRCLTSAPQRTRVVAERVGRQARGVRRHLQRLQRHGLAVLEAEGWCRTDRDLDDVAQALNVAGEGARQRARHQEEREANRRRQAIKGYVGLTTTSTRRERG